MEIHPLALLVGKELGMSEDECKAEVESIGKAIDGLYLDSPSNAAIVAIAATAVLRLEQEPSAWLSPEDDTLEHDDVRGRVVRALEVAFDGLY